MWRFRLIPDNTKVPFLELRRLFFGLSIFLAVASVVVLIARGLNFGIDFEGGILIEVGTEQPANLGEMRGVLGELGLGEVALQEFGSPTDVLIRVERQPGDAEAQQAAVSAVRSTLDSLYGDSITYRRTEFVGPKVGSELIQAGIIAVVVSVALMLIYIWFRFELPFAIGAVIALIHDVVLTLGMFAARGLEFNLSTVAAILLIVGYSMNDTVVVYDRVRENLRKYKALPLIQLLNLSVNETLSRTVITSGTTLLALLALFIFGGEVIRDFSFAMIWGILIGTYSSIFVAGALLLYVQPKRTSRKAKVGFGTAERTEQLEDLDEADEFEQLQEAEALADTGAGSTGADAEGEPAEAQPQSRARRRASSARARKRRKRTGRRRGN